MAQLYLPSSHRTRLRGGLATAIDTTQEKVLQEADLLRVATVSSQGDPYVLPVRFHFDGASLYFLSPPESAQLRQLRAHRRVAVVAETPGTPVTGVVVQGLAQFVRGQAERQRTLAALAARYSESAIEGSEATLVKVTPLHVETFQLEDG